MEATSSHTVSTSSLTIILGRDGEKHGTLDMCTHEKGLSFYLFNKNF